MVDAMNTSGRAHAIAAAAEPFRPLLGLTSAADLLGWLEAELGHAERQVMLAPVDRVLCRIPGPLQGGLCVRTIRCVQSDALSMD